MNEIKRRRHHNKAYRCRAVELLLTGRTLSELSTELGVSTGSLQNWKKEYLIEMSENPPDATGLTPVELVQKYQQLVKEHEKLKASKRS